MRLRICDGGHERLVPASLELVERVFAPDAAIADGTEIGVADGARWLVAMAVQAPDGEAVLLSGESTGGESVAGRVDRATALQRFREFLVTSMTG